mmetsp:Transcript_8770/g.19639  ORF Transcript_8770/g.19639 Transcript_8770/m.19639 type:complete len:289 (+) Transcript_8770:3156-4022(+)
MAYLDTRGAALEDRSTGAVHSRQRNPTNNCSCSVNCTGLSVGRSFFKAGSSEVALSSGPTVSIWLFLHASTSISAHWASMYERQCIGCSAPKMTSAREHMEPAGCEGSRGGVQSAAPLVDDVELTQDRIKCLKINSCGRVDTAASGRLRKVSDCCNFTAMRLKVQRSQYQVGCFFDNPTHSPWYFQPQSRHTTCRASGNVWPQKQTGASDGRSGSELASGKHKTCLEASTCCFCKIFPTSPSNLMANSRTPTSTVFSAFFPEINPWINTASNALNKSDAAIQEGWDEA